MYVNLLSCSSKITKEILFLVNIVKRGCVSNLTQQQYDDCARGEFCKICYKDYCNSKKGLTQSCYACNSADDPSCATLQSPLKNKTCGDYSDVCKVYVKPNMTTNRGCASEMTQDIVDCHPQAVNCRQCSENLCNGEIFPPNRLSCFHGSEECHDENQNCYRDQSENLDLNHPCEIYNFRDSCILYLSENKTATRGCLSDSFFSEFCTKNPQKCKTCQTSNCNSESVIQSPKLSCIMCESSEECLYGFDENFAKPCEHDVFFYEQESCFTFKVSDEKIIRGCTLDQKLCQINNCTYCYENGCNNQGYTSQSCYKCSSENDKKCVDDLVNVKKISCVGVKFEDRGCYALKDENEIIHRGCIAELSNLERIKCNHDENNCVICKNSTNCNSQIFSSGKNREINFKIFIFVILLIFISCLNSK